MKNKYLLFGKQMTRELFVEHKFLDWFNVVRFLLVVRNVECDVDAMRGNLRWSNRSEEVCDANVIRIFGIQIGANANR